MRDIENLNHINGISSSKADYSRSRSMITIATELHISWVSYTCRILHWQLCNLASHLTSCSDLESHIIVMMSNCNDQ